MEIGPMLFDLHYKLDNGHKSIGGNPVFFDARLVSGVLIVPQELYEEVNANAT